MIAVWGAGIAVFLALELATVGLTSIWFALGSAAALLCALLGAALWVQIVCFAAVSAAALALTRPLARKYINSRAQPTNADRVLGADALVRERIDNLEETGAVAVDGKVWTARSADGSVIDPGTAVTVQRIDGVKLIVTPLEETETSEKEDPFHAP